MTEQVYSLVEKLGGTTQVDAHLRRQGDVVTLVDAHQRKVKDPAELTAAKNSELAMWHAWKESGKTPDAVRPLLASMKGMLSKIGNNYKRNKYIPPAAIDAEVYVRALEALNSYDPSRGAALGSWVFGHVDRRLKRYAATYHNIARIPEERDALVGQYQAAEAELNEQLGRPPSNEELSGVMDKSVSVRTIAKLRKEVRRDLWSENFDPEKGGDPTATVVTRMEEIATLIRPELTPDELKVFDVVMSGDSKKTRSLSATTGFPNYKISRLKRSIAKKIDRYGE